MTQANHTFSVQSRAILGKKSKQLRDQGLLVGSISIPNKESIHIQVSYRDFAKLLDSVSESTLLYLVVDDKKQPIPTLIDSIQYSPITQEMLHVTFKKVSLTETVEAEIEIEFVGEVEASGGSLITVRDTVLVEALPTDLPESFEVDLSTITEIGSSITLADLNVDSSKVTIVVSEDQTLEDMPIVIYQAQQEEEVDESSDSAELVEPEITGGAAETEASEPSES